MTPKTWRNTSEAIPVARRVTGDPPGTDMNNRGVEADAGVRGGSDGAACSTAHHWHVTRRVAAHLQPPLVPRHHIVHYLNLVLVHAIMLSCPIRSVSTTIAI